tara:strand:- start:475 stop:1836 length:1362 start_codon:yes stop_codon:yes gene_type:complete
MLISFRTGNYRSFKDDQELSFVASPIKNNDSYVLKCPGFKNGILPIAAVYGANASGKSNLIAALKYMIKAIMESYSDWKEGSPLPVHPYLGGGSSKKPSYFEIEFIFKNVRYQYGFVITKIKFIEEWLYSYPNTKKKVLFERNVGKKSTFKFGRDLKGPNNTIGKITGSGSLFLSTASQNNHELLLSISNWFMSNFNFASEEDRELRIRTTSMNIQENGEDIPVSELLKAADFGISGIRVEKRENKISQEQYANISNALRSFGVDNDDKFKFPENGIDFPEYKVLFEHSTGNKSRNFILEISEESNGTREYFSLIGSIASTLSTGSLLIIDEIERSLHPHIANNLVRLFTSKKINTNSAQLMFTTHSANILGAGNLRRDEIWFTEKDQKGASHLYPLTDFKPRDTENLERGYLQGRFGAIPFLGEFEKLNQLEIFDGPKKKKRKPKKKKVAAA